MKFVLVGFISGLCTGLGLGGGSILILVLTLFFNINQRIAQATNLICFIPSAVVAILSHLKDKKINISLALKIIPFGIIGAITGSMISINIDLTILRKLFGIFLLIICVLEFVSFFKMNIKENSGDNKK